MGEYAWMFGAGMFLLTALSVYGTWVVARYKGEQAFEAARSARERADSVERELAAFRAEANARFATIEMLEKSENRVADAINRLADRLDRVLETTRPAPRTRATKA